VGCAQGCTFCATGTMGLLLNLTPGEILEQILWANSIERQRLAADEDPFVRNVVFMGMGEPLDNYEAVVAAIRGMVDPGRFGMGARRISLSTVLPHPRLLDRILRDVPMVSLAFSLHAPTQEVRSKIVPSAKGWKLEKGMEQLWDFCRGQEEYWKNWKSVARTQRNQDKTSQEMDIPRILIEYILLKDLNCTQEIAVKLGELLRDKPVILNLIPYNPVPLITQLYGYDPPTQSDIDEFLAELRKVPGLVVHVRQELGQDVGAACGQLVVEHDESIKRLKKQPKVRDVEDLFSKTKLPPSDPLKTDNQKNAALKRERDLTMDFLLALAFLIGIWLLKVFVKWFIK
jgi:adenine C2-methylase RlmN of 23S rRNA A2503 and tRNA A37